MFSNVPISEWIEVILSPQTLLSIEKKHSLEFQILSAAVMDKIWFARNLLIHMAIQSYPSYALNHQVISTSRSHLLAWENISPSKSVWTLPPLGFLKANFDVAIQNGLAVAAAILSDSFKILLLQRAISMLW